jgi:hypothetical protein
MESQKPIAEQLFGEALDIPRDRRSAFLYLDCRGTPEVRRAADSLPAENG